MIKSWYTSDKQGLLYFPLFLWLIWLIFTKYTLGQCWFLKSHKDDKIKVKLQVNAKFHHITAWLKKLRGNYSRIHISILKFRSHYTCLIIMSVWLFLNTLRCASLYVMDHWSNILFTPKCFALVSGTMQSIRNFKPTCVGFKIPCLCHCFCIIIWHKSRWIKNFLKEGYIFLTSAVGISILICDYLELEYIF